MENNLPIYLDYNASTPICEEACEVMKNVITECFGNPSSDHVYGRMASEKVELARKKVSLLLGCKSTEVVFTSGGTESNNWAIKGVAIANKHKGNHIITSQIEHPAVIEVCKYLHGQGFEVTYLPVDKYGTVSAKDVEDSITEETILVSIMHANNETGAIQPIEEIGKITRQKGVLFHVDASQSIGKIAVDVEKLGVDLLSVAAHKLYGPKGIGALFIKEGVILEKFMHGANHERGFRAGTENVIEIVGFGEAAEVARIDFEKNVFHMQETRDILKSMILNSGIDCIVNGYSQNCLPNTLSISFKDILAGDILHSLPEIAASSGSACHSGCVDYSTVLKAMNVPSEYALGTLRLSTGKYLSKEDVVFVANLIVKTVRELVMR